MEQIAKVIVGSHLHGLNNEDSDVDTRAVHMDSLLSVVSPFHSEQSPQGDGDFESYELRKFCKMCASGNPTALEVLWSDKIENTSEVWKYMRGCRTFFLSGRRIASAHIGYIDASIKALTKMTEPKKRLRKHYAAGLRIGLQAEQLLKTRGFHPRIEDYSLEWHNRLLAIKENDAPADYRYCQIAIEDLLKQKESIREVEKEHGNFEADTEWIGEMLLEAYYADWGH